MMMMMMKKKKLRFCLCLFFLFFFFFFFFSFTALCEGGGRKNGSSISETHRKGGKNTASNPPKLHTLFSVECNDYFDWQTIGLMNSYWKSGHPGPITRLLSCTHEDLKKYRGMDLAPTHVVPSMSHHPKTGDW